MVIREKSVKLFDLANQLTINSVIFPHRHREACLLAKLEVDLK